MVFPLRRHGHGRAGPGAGGPTFHTLLASTVNLLTAVTDVGGGRVVLSASLEEPTNGAADRLVPESPYAAAKLAAGAYARMFVKLYDTPVVSLRPFMAYGPGQNPMKIIPYTILSLLRGDAPQLSSGERALDWVYVEDVIDAFLAAASCSGVEAARWTSGGEPPSGSVMWSIA